MKSTSSNQQQQQQQKELQLSNILVDLQEFNLQSDFDLLQNVFAGLYSLDKNEYIIGNKVKSITSSATTSVTAYNKDNNDKIENSYEEILTKAINNPNKYVMKPQREGGGNNIYNEKVSF